MRFHHHLLAFDKNKTSKKINEKQKKETTKGDWFQLLKEDLKFIEVVMGEDKKNHIQKKKEKEL